MNERGDKERKGNEMRGETGRKRGKERKKKVK